MIISVIGSGGREHAICKKISESPQVSKIYCIPGNAGTSEIAENIEIDVHNFNKIKNFLIKSKTFLESSKSSSSRPKQYIFFSKGEK